MVYNHMPFQAFWDVLERMNLSLPATPAPALPTAQATFGERPVNEDRRKLIFNVQE
ncbi:hypothetical protein PI125_g6723 [Phytophthora idaei]|nr:hypothetical protein PI125_g6723 [Phytophthora idaei]